MVAKIILFLILSVFFIEQVASHPGRTNSSGCHNDRKTGGYHCHNSGSSYSGRSSYSSSSYSSSSSNSKSYKSPSPYKNDYGKETVKEIQRLLKKGGYEPGPIDGIAGAKTVKAIMKFQGDNGMRKDGLPSSSLLATLRKKYSSG